MNAETEGAQVNPGRDRHTSDRARAKLFGRARKTIPDLVHETNEFLQGKTLDDMLTDRMLLKSVNYNVLLIGEAVCDVPVEVRERYPMVDWRGLIAMRQVLAHNYSTVDQNIVWEAATTSIQALLDVDSAGW